jgi:hypothetical protein
VVVVMMMVVVVVLVVMMMVVVVVMMMMMMMVMVMMMMMMMMVMMMMINQVGKVIAKAVASMERLRQQRDEKEKQLRLAAEQQEVSHSTGFSMILYIVFL